MLMTAAAASTPSRRREFCHVNDTPFFIPIETTTKGRGRCSRMTVSPTARHARRPGGERPKQAAAACSPREGGAISDPLPPHHPPTYPHPHAQTLTRTQPTPSWPIPHSKTKRREPDCQRTGSRTQWRFFSAERRGVFCSAPQSEIAITSATGAECLSSTQPYAGPSSSAPAVSTPAAWPI